jgi:hypothetical protein
MPRSSRDLRALTTLSFSFCAAVAACAAPVASNDAPSAESAATSASTIHTHAVKTLGPVFARPVQGIATEAAARALEGQVKDDARQLAFDQCAATLGLPVEAVSTRLVGLVSNVLRDASDGRFTVTAQTGQTYCASASLDQAVLVTFDGDLHTEAPLRTAGQVLLDPGLAHVVDDAGQLGKICATRPHLMARFNDGAFNEVSGLSGVDAKKGGTIDVELPFAEDALLLDVPSAATRFEMYFRVERWNVSGFFEDGNFTGTLVSPASDAFISNFGANYRLPVTR